MPAVQKCAISWGLLHVPVALHTATQDNDLHFNQLCKEDGSRVKYKKVCASCGKEVGADGIVKGFEFEPGKYITMTDADFEKAKTERDKALKIEHFAALSEIPPIYFDRTYHAVPEAGSDKAYELLRRIMLDEKKVAICQSVIGQSEKLICLIPTATGILVETMFYIDEVKAMPKEPAHPELTEAEVTMAKTLMSGMVQRFDPSKYHDGYQVRLREIIEAKIQGKEVTTAPEEGAGNVLSMMDALEAMMKNQGKTPPKKRVTRKKKTENAS